MRFKKIILSIAVLLQLTFLYAQPSLDSLLYYVYERNLSLQTANKLLESRQLNARTGLTPENPEVEFGYMWGDPSDVGNRTDFAVTQSFDFPTTYSSKSKLSKINQSQAEIEYQATRQKISLNARKLWINAVFLNILESLYDRRLTHAQKMFEGFERKLETGEGNQLQLNHAGMKVTALKNEVSLLQREFSKNKAELLNLTGNYDFFISDTILPPASNIIFDTLLARYNDSYLNRLNRLEVEKKITEVDLAFDQKLPKLSAGYYSESILDTKLRGLNVGITIPLWENSRTMQSARANQAYAESNADLYRLHQQNELKNLFGQWVSLKDQVTNLEQLLVVSNNEALLQQAMEAGEISLTGYFYESDFYFQNIVNLLEIKKELLLIEADLLKVYY